MSLVISTKDWKIQDGKYVCEGRQAGGRVEELGVQPLVSGKKLMGK